MFATRTIVSFIRATKNFRNAVLLAQKTQINTLSKPHPVLSSSLLRCDPVSRQTRNYAKGKDKKKEKGKYLIHNNDSSLPESYRRN